MLRALTNCHDTDPPCTMPITFASELAVNDRPPRNKGELMGFLDHGELAAR